MCVIKELFENITIPTGGCCGCGASGCGGCSASSGGSCSGGMACNTSNGAVPNEGKCADLSRSSQEGDKIKEDDSHKKPANKKIKNNNNNNNTNNNKNKIKENINETKNKNNNVNINEANKEADGASDGEECGSDDDVTKTQYSNEFICDEVRTICSFV